MNTNKGSIVKQSDNDVEGCRSEKVLVNVFLQYSVNSGENNVIFLFQIINTKECIHRDYHSAVKGIYDKI